MRARHMKSKPVDFESPLEVAVNSVGMAIFGVGIFCLFLALVCFIFFLLAAVARLRGFSAPFDTWLHPIPCLILISLPFLALGGLASWVRSRLDIHYYLDPEREQLMLARNIFSYKGVRPVAAFADIHSLAVGGKFHSESQGKSKPPKEYWTTALFAVTKDGKKIRLTDWDLKEEWRQQGLDQLLGVPIVAPPDLSTQVLVVKRSKGGVSINYAEANDLFVSCLGCAGANLGCLALVGIAQLIWTGVLILEHWMWG